MFDSINFNGNKYPTLEVMLNEQWGGVVAPESLENALVMTNWDEARWIDDGIFFYVPDELFEAGDEEAVVRFVEEHCV